MKKWKIVLLAILILFLFPLPNEYWTRTNDYYTNDVEHGCLITGKHGATIFTEFFFEWDGGECHKPKNSIGHVYLSIGLFPVYFDMLPHISIFAPGLDSYAFTIYGFENLDQEFRPRVGVKTLNVPVFRDEFDYDFAIFYGCRPHEQMMLSYSTSCDIVVKLYPFEIYREEIEYLDMHQ